LAGQTPPTAIETFAKFGFTVHLGSQGQKSKTEAMHIPSHSPDAKDAPPPNPSDTEDFVVIHDGEDSKYVSYVDKFKYLGSFITPDGTDEHDIESRLTSAAQMFGMMRSVLCNRSIDQGVRRSIYTGTVLNVLLFGSETWALSQKQRDKLNSFHTKRVRSMLGINMFHVKEHHIKNEDVLSRFGVPDLSTILDTRILRFITKVALMPESRLTRQMATSFYAPDGDKSKPKYNKATHTRTTWRKILKDRKLLSAKEANDFGSICDAVISPDWSKKVESNLGLKPGTFFSEKYSLRKTAQHAHAARLARERQNIVGRLFGSQEGVAFFKVIGGPDATGAVPCKIIKEFSSYHKINDVCKFPLNDVKRYIKMWERVQRQQPFRLTPLSPSAPPFRPLHLVLPPSASPFIPRRELIMARLSL
jgi:hypothetical protein